MILEGLVTTRSTQGTPHLAPMGPRVEGADFARFTLRPFPTSTTFQNLRAHGQGVLHVTDDAALIARAALGAVDPFPALLPAEAVEGWILAESCRFYEFEVRDIDTRSERVSLTAEVLRSGWLRDFWGFNRAKHAVVEAAILATRFHLLALDEISAEFQKLRVIVTKTGGEAEASAMDFLESRLAQERARKGAS